MTKEITNKEMCVYIRDGVKLWVSEEQGKKLLDLLVDSPNARKFIAIGNQCINVADIKGIFDPETMEEMTNEKRGQWKCEYGVWHDKYEECNCYHLRYPPSYRTIA